MSEIMVSKNMTEEQFKKELKRGLEQAFDEEYGEDDGIEMTFYCLYVQPDRQLTERCEKEVLQELAEQLGVVHYAFRSGGPLITAGTLWAMLNKHESIGDFAIVLFDCDKDKVTRFGAAEKARLMEKLDKAVAEERLDEYSGKLAKEALDEVNAQKQSGA